VTRGRIAAALLALVVLPTVARAQPAARETRVLVMPFENVTHDNRIFWLGEACAVLLTDDLNALGGSAITREERREAFDRLQVPPAASLTEATVIRIGQLVGASQIIIGSLRMDGDALVVQARSIGLEAGKLQADVSERGPMPEIFSTVERVARKLAPPSSRSSAEIQREHPPVAAFENYIKGLLVQTPATAISYFTTALQLQPTFDRVRLALWDVYSEQDAHDKALASVLPVPAASPWYRRARFLAGLSQIGLKKYDEAFATFKALADAKPTATVFNNLGVVQMRRGSTPQTGLSTYYFNKAAEADPAVGDYFFNLGYAYWIDHDTQAAIYWLREAVRRDPTDGDAHFVLGTALSAAGNPVEANREKELARRLSSTYAEWEKRSANDSVPKGLERIKHDVELPHARRVEETLARNGQRDQRELAQFYLDRGRRLFERENDRDALAELNRAIFLSPYLAQAHLLVGRIHLRGGRVAEAIDALKISLWSEESAEAHAVLAEAYLENKDLPAARSEAQRALVLAPGLENAARVLDKIR
jgi:tetratricopeptide (TPR) repeat protein/TolB-like protein